MSTCGQAGVTTPPPLDPTSPPPAPPRRPGSTERPDGWDGGRANEEITTTHGAINDMLASARKKGLAQAERDMADKLGMTVEEARAAIDAAQRADREKMTEADRKIAEANDAKAAAEKLRSDTAAERHSLRVERSLLRAGVPADDADLLADAVTLVRVDPAADDKAIADAIEAVKGRHPGMFTGKPATAPPPGHTPPDVRPPSGRQTPPASGHDPQVERQLARRGINIGAKAS